MTMTQDDLMVLVRYLEMLSKLKSADLASFEAICREIQSLV